MNVSQNPDRVKPFSGLVTFTRNSCFYSYEHDVVVSGHAHMRGLGWPRAMTDSHRFSDHGMRDLAGDGVSVPVYMVIENCFYNNPFATWWR